MTDKNSASDSRTIQPNTVYIGEGASIKGDILAPDMLVVDGCIEGSVTGHAIWVGPSGEIKGKIVVDEAEIFGKISEKIEIKQLLLVHAAGNVSGDIIYGELQLEKGAVLSGTLARNEHQHDDKGPKLDQSMGKHDRPAVIPQIEPSSLRKSNGAGLNGHLPAPEIQGT